MISGHSLTPAPVQVQRACSQCDDPLPKLDGVIMRKCACATGDDCSCTGPERIDRDASSTSAAAAGQGQALRQVSQVVSGSGRPLEPGVRRDMEAHFGRSFERARVHDDSRAAASARGIAAHAYTVGDHIVFGQGQYRPSTRSGRFLLAHELAHTVQQSGGGSLQPSSRISRPSDPHERQADAAAAAVLAARPVPGLTPAAPVISRYSFGEFWDDVTSVPGAIYDGAGELVEGAADAAEWAWDRASDFAAALDSAIDFTGGVLTVTIPEFDPCPSFSTPDLSLGDLGLAPSVFVPLVVGVLPLNGAVNLYGAFGLNASIDPSIALQLNGCNIGPTVISIDPLGLDASLDAAIAISGALSLGATVDLGVRGEVGVLIVIPPAAFNIPVAGIELGGTAQGRAIGGGTITNALHVGIGLGGASFSHHVSGTLTLAGDLGVGAYAAVDVLGFNLCRMNWPFYEWHDQITGEFDLGLDFSVSTSGIDADITLEAARVPTSPFDTLPLALDRSVLQDDCPLCTAFYDIGIMPSQNGGAWTGHPAPELGGPLREVYPKNPSIPSGALCRGVCGVDCAEGSCSVPYDRYVCEQSGDGHIWHVYAGYISCGSHQGCRDHDACYDWAVGFGEGGGLLGVIFGPIHRLCDFECLCTYGLPQCVGWATANPPYDSSMRFADYAYTLPGCMGPCPQETQDAEGNTVQQTCLPEVELLAAQHFDESWEDQFGPVQIFREFVEVPYIIGIWIGVDAWAAASAEAYAELGPVTLENACLVYDRGTGEYYGTASLVAALTVGGGVSLTGSVDAWASDFLCLLRVVDMEGGLNARANAALPNTLSYDVELVCRNGDLWVEHGVSLESCLSLAFDLDAFFNLDIFNIRLLEKRWNLISAQWDKCWNMTIDFDPILVGQAPTISFDSTLLQVLEALDWLFDMATPGGRGVRRIGADPARDKGLLNPCGGDDDDPPTPGGCATVIEDPVTSATAHTLGLGGIDHTDWTRQTFSLPTGGSETVGVAMESVYLTDRHTPGSDRTSRVQNDIYRFRKLPTLGAFGRGTPPGRADVMYIKGHLLNGNIGGPAQVHNLYPITAQANSAHSNQVEGQVKGLVRDRHMLVYYKVDVINRQSPQLIDVFGDNTCFYYSADSAFDCTFATYRLCEGNVLERNTEVHRTISSSFATSAFVNLLQDPTRNCPERP